MTIGSWQLEKSKSNLKTPPKAQITQMEAIPNGVKWTLDTEGADGQRAHQEYIAFHDGRFYPLSGDPTATEILRKMRTPFEAFTIRRKDGKEVSYRLSVYALDGKSYKSMQTDADGKPLDEEFAFYERIEPSQSEGQTKGPQDAASDTLKGLGFGVALSLKWNIIGPKIVRDASIDNNKIVRIDQRSNTDAGLMLEMHHYPWTFGGDTKNRYDNTWGFGPFVAAQPGSEQVITAVGGGLMFGWKLKPNDIESQKGFGIGVGYAAIPSAKTLGDEFKDGEPAPKDTTQVRFVQRDKGSVLIIAAFTF